MIQVQHSIETKSAERRAYEHYLRTGRIASPNAADEIEHKFNPYHDPRNGEFTFAPGGPRSLGRVTISDRGRSYLARQVGARRTVSGHYSGSPSLEPATPGSGLQSAVFQPGTSAPLIEDAQYRPNARVRIGDNKGPPLNDPLVLGKVFPRLGTAPAGSILGIVDNALELTGPGARLTTGLAQAHVTQLITQIRTLDPGYRLDSFGFPTTLEGQVNLIQQLRIVRAVTFYRTRQETRPLQVEILRVMQESSDKAYDEGVAFYEGGRLNVRLSREEAIGNFVDRRVRSDLRDFFSMHGIDTSKGQAIRVVGREYDSSGTDRTYRIPDARVGNIAFDVTLTRKTLATPQIRGFFAGDFRPSAVVIIRPRQIGPGSSYAITRPEKKP